jgi:hypothetical protein
MQRVGVIGIGFKGLLATELGVEILFGPQMAHAGLIERSRRVHAGAI